MLKKLTVIMDTSLRRELEDNRDLRYSFALMAALRTPANLVSACMSCGDVVSTRYWSNHGIWFGVNGSETAKMITSMRNANRIEGILSYKDGTLRLVVSFFPKGNNAPCIYLYKQEFHLGNQYK